MAPVKIARIMHCKNALNENRWRLDTHSGDGWTAGDVYTSEAAAKTARDTYVTNHADDYLDELEEVDE